MAAVTDALSTLDQNGSRSDRDSERPDCTRAVYRGLLCTLKTLPLPHFRYHVTDNRCVRVASVLVESVDTAT